MLFLQGLVIPNRDAPWTLRVDRARHLATVVSEASELLTFYGELTTFQQGLARASTPVTDAGARTFEHSIDRSSVVDAVPRFLDWLRVNAPSPLATAVAALRLQGAHAWQERVNAFLRGDYDVDPHCGFVVEALVQPFAESAASARAASGDSPRLAVDRTCPFCARRPSVAAFREAGHGARRFLVCGLCLTEWPFTRIGCASCGESRFDQLPVFTADSVAAARIDACDSCHGYLKAVDFTRDGHAIAVVDDLATLSLDLWASEHGYTRLRPHILGI